MGNILVDIYVIIDPFTEKVKYVGQTRRGLRRKYEHFSNKRPTKKKKYPIDRWIHKCYNLGKKPIYKVIDRVILEKADDSEIHYIKLFRSFGARLLNLTAGGYGVRMTENHMSQKIKGKTLVDVYGKEKAEEIIKKREHHFLGKNNPNFGGKLSKKSLLKNRMSQKLVAISVFKEEILIGIFMNACEASKFIGCQPSKIRHYKKYGWKVNREFVVRDTPKEMIPLWKPDFMYILFTQ